MVAPDDWCLEHFTEVKPEQSGDGECGECDISFPCHPSRISPTPCIRQAGKALAAKEDGDED
jgi:hypothetical protein